MCRRDIPKLNSMVALLSLVSFLVPGGSLIISATRSWGGCNSNFSSTKSICALYASTSMGTPGSISPGPLQSNAEPHRHWLTPASMTMTSSTSSAAFFFAAASACVGECSLNAAAKESELVVGVGKVTLLARAFSRCMAAALFKKCSPVGRGVAAGLYTEQNLRKAVFEIFACRELRKNSIDRWQSPTVRK